MKDFLGILQKMYGVKDSYKTHQIIEAHNAFCLKQVIQINRTTEIKEQGYYTVDEKGHPWYGRLVKSTLIENKDGMVAAYFGTQTKHFHKSKLI